MLSRARLLACAFLMLLAVAAIPTLHGSPMPTWSGILRDSGGNPVGTATIKLVAVDSNHEHSASTSAMGQFEFAVIVPGDYTLTVSAAGKVWTAADRVVVKDGARLSSSLRLVPEGQELRVVITQETASPQASGGEHLSTGEVSSLPLNERDFSKLLLLAAGTMHASLDAELPAP